MFVCKKDFDALKVKCDDLLCHIDKLNNRIDVLEFQRDFPKGLKLTYSTKKVNWLETKLEYEVVYLKGDRFVHITLPDTNGRYCLSKYNIIEEFDFDEKFVARYKVNQDRNVLVEVALAKDKKADIVIKK